MKRLFIVVALFLCLKQLNVSALDISAECACLINADNNEVVFEYNGYKEHSMASTTKIMTAILALEKAKPDEIVTVSANASSQEGSSIYLKTGEQISMENLVYGMMLNSGNDAACAVAEHIGGTSDEFALMMSEKAKEIGAKNTSFKNANGLDAAGHYSTAYDMAIISAYGLKNENFKNIVSTKNAQIDNGETITYLKNHNKLLWNYDGCIGVKTGYTKKTGRCLVSAAEKDGVTLIAVTLNAPNDWQDHEKMLDYGFENVKRHQIIKSGDILKRFDMFNAVAQDDIFVTGNKNNSKIILHTVREPNYNILKGEKIGYAEIFYDNKLVNCVDLISDREFVKKEEKSKGFFYELITIIKMLLLKY
jgi:D-alanyl-D-alanine carboxypeptidase (penicillin-binding protein 5/6)